MDGERQTDDARALELLRSYVGKVRRGPVELSAPYLRALRLWEAQPENQDGCDKTWVERSRRRFRQHFARAKRIR